MADDVQPDSAGQGSEPAGGGFFESDLQAVPEDLRDQVAPYFERASKNIGGRLQEAAEFKNQWEPYQQVEALRQYSPEDLAQLLDWHQQVGYDENAYLSWLRQQAEEHGLTQQQAQDLEQMEYEGLSQAQIEQIANERAAQVASPLEQRMAELEWSRDVELIQSDLQGELRRLETDRGIQLTREQQKDILDLGNDYDGENWVEYGFNRYEEMASRATRSFVEDKARAPQTPVTTGGNPAFKPTTDWAEATQQAKERLRQALQA